MWSGNYSTYAAGKEREVEKQREAYADRQAETKRVEADIGQTKEQARGTESRTKSGAGADYLRGRAKKVARKDKVRERRLEKLLANGDRIEKPRQSWGLHLADLGRSPIEDERTIVAVEKLRAGYGDRDVLRGVDLFLRGRDRMALLGENGSGKSTLIGCIAGTISFDGTVTIGPSVRIGLLSQETEGLPLDRSVLEVFRSRTEMGEDEVRTYLHKFLFSGDAVFKLVSALSYGQRAKLALATLILSLARSPEGEADHRGTGSVSPSVRVREGSVCRAAPGGAEVWLQGSFRVG